MSDPFGNNDSALICMNCHASRAFAWRAEPTFVIICSQHLKHDGSLVTFETNTKSASKKYEC